MKNNIETLVDQLEPIKTIKSIKVRLITWSLVAITNAIAWLSIFGIRNDINYQLATPAFLIELSIILLLIISAGYAALVLSIPGRFNRKFSWVIGGLIIAWIVSWGLSINLNNPLLYFESTASCALKIAMVATIPICFFIWEFRRIFTISTLLIGLFVFLSAASVGLFVISNFCYISDHMHTFMWHFLPIIIISLTGIMLARYCFKSL
jgi:hypothetical protein